MDNNFLGRGWAFPPKFMASGSEMPLVEGEEDIRQSLKILLSTSTKERIMYSDYGCDLNQYLFEEVDQNLLNGLRETVSTAILKYEGRIQVDGIDIRDGGGDQGLLHISIDYTVRTTNNRYNLVYPFYLNEANLKP